MPATGEVLLDTSVVVAHLRGIKAVTDRLAQFETLHLPMVALGELLCGIRKASRSQENLAGLRRWLQAVTLLPLGEVTAEQYAAIKTELMNAGAPIPENDVWIAAQARELGLPLATQDEHFKRVSGLVVLDWR